MVEKAFPRGRGSNPGQQERKDKLVERKKRKDHDVLFGGSKNTSASNKKTKTDTKKQKRDETVESSISMLPIGGGGCNRSKYGNHIEALGFQKLQPGLKALAVCRQVQEDLAIFSLPNLWTAYMRRRDDEAPLNISLQPNQVISVVIVKAVQESTKEGPRRRIEVSCHPSSINPMDYNVKDIILRGMVRSVEDHGILVDLGMNRTGFVAFGDIENEYSTKLDDESDSSTLQLHEGRILDFVVKATTNSKVVPLRICKSMEKVALPPGHKPQIQDLQPGTLIQSVVVENTMSNGLAVLFGGGTFRGAVEMNHLGALWVPESNHDENKWKKFFREHPSFPARILVVDPKSKIIRLTLLPHLMNLETPSWDTLPKAGDVVEECTVVKVDPGVGVLLAYPDPVEEDLPITPIDETDEGYMEAIRMRAIYVHISKTLDKLGNGQISHDSFSKKFSLSSKHTVRVLQTNNLVDGIASGATAPDIINAAVMNLEDVVPGKLYKQLPIVKNLKGGSVVADFGNGIRGVIPTDQMFDEAQASNIRDKLRGTKYAIGSKVDVRVLTVEVEERRLVLTVKKSLVQAIDEEVVSSYEDINEGQIVVGFVSRVDKGGVFVSLFNNVYGRVTASSLTAELGIDSPVESYRRGDVLRCRVVYVKEINRTRRQTGEDELNVDERTPIKPRYELRLSLLLEHSAPSTEIVSGKQQSLVALQVGTILPAKCMRVVEICSSRRKGQRFAPGYAIVAIRAKYLLTSKDLANAPEIIECKLPFDQILDEYDDEYGENLEMFDDKAQTLLTKGQKIKKKGTILVDPKKSMKDYHNGVGDLVIVTIKPEIINVVENQCDEQTDGDMSFPGPGCHLFEGAVVVGQVRSLDTRYGAFINFREDWRGLFPKTKGGLSLKKYNTVKATVLVVDHAFSPPRILLGPTSFASIGSKIPVAKVTKVDFKWLHVTFKEGNDEVSGRVNCSQLIPVKELEFPSGGCHTRVITSCHPFWGISQGDEVKNLKLTKVTTNLTELASAEVCTSTDFHASVVGDKLSGIVMDTNKHTGLILQISPSCLGCVPWLELSEDPEVLRNPTAFFPIGSRLHCLINEAPKANGDLSMLRDCLQLSVLRMREEKVEGGNPSPGDLVVGLIDRSTSRIIRPPELLLKLRNGRIGRCCVTELDESDEWTNFPVGRQRDDPMNESLLKRLGHSDIVTCRVLQKASRRAAIEVSLRPSRILGDIEPDQKPLPGSIVPGYVIETNRKGCFVRLSRETEARATLKELCDGFIADPSLSFPPGRLVAAKVKDIRAIERVNRGVRFNADIDMRESKIGDGESITFGDLQAGSRFDGVISRTESYGVFVAIERSDVTAFVHRSECSDKGVSDANEHFRPGDHVKLKLLEVDTEKRRVGATMKASALNTGSDSDSDVDDDIQAMDLEEAAQSDDERSEGDSSESDSAASGDGSDSQDSNGDDESSGLALNTNVGFDFAGKTILENKESESESESSDSESEDEGDTSKKKSKRSRKKQAERRKQEETIAKREVALADGTADENPETAADFERLLASQPNSSELWIRFMAFYLGLANVSAARNVAERAFDRIEFRLETEKLNVWCALLMLEMKYGDGASLDDAKERACRHNNPKHVHLRMCEMYEKVVDEVSTFESKAKADEMFESTCKKFKSKKKVWIAFFEYLLKSGRQEEAFRLSKRSLLSLKQYKHAETMSKFAQLMFQYGSAEKARTILEGLLRTHPKRLDIFFVYVDKEIKHGDKEMARSLFAKVANKQDTTLSLKLTDKQMKSFFKKWFAFEENHGSEETREAVKDAARKYVQG